MFCLSSNRFSREKQGTHAWPVLSGDVFTVVKSTGNLQTKRGFGDCQLHIEWRARAEIKWEGQERGNRGVYLQGHYEVQVLDSYNNPTYSNGQTASIYKQYIPLVNASRKPGEWQKAMTFCSALRVSPKMEPWSHQRM